MPAIAIVFLPKCPLCVAAYLGALSSLGAGTWLNAAWGLPLCASLAAIAVGALFLRGRRSGDYSPTLLGLAGAAALLVGKLAIETPAVIYGGVALLVVASVWSARRDARSPVGHPVTTGQPSTNTTS